MTKKVYFPAIFTVLGVLAGSIGWLIGYSIVYTPAIEFDGPAAIALAGSMLVTGLAVGFWVFATYAHANPHRKLLPATILCIIGGMLACISLGYVISTYEIQHTEHCVARDGTTTCVE